MDDPFTGCAPFLAGGGRLARTPGGARLILPAARASRYADAQLDDYASLPRRRFPHRPPIRLSLRARFSHDAASLAGTAGFGFWNNPFGAQSRIPTLPQAAWFFFASPPSNMALAQGLPGSGWKAAAIDASRPSAWAWAPLAPFVLLACRLPRLSGKIWPRVQRGLGIHESLLEQSREAMTDWRRYELEWRRDGVQWRVDGQAVLQADQAPRGPLGFVAWIDNQYAIVTPRGSVGFGLVDVPEQQWLEISDVRLSDRL